MKNEMERLRRQVEDLKAEVLRLQQKPKDSQHKGVILHKTETLLDSETALRQSEEKFRLAFQTSPDSINFNRLSDGMYIDINEGFTNLTGYTREDAIGKTSIELNIWHDPIDRERLVTGLMTEGFVKNFEASFLRKDGQIVTGLMFARVLDLNKEKMILSITRDITERKKAEELLRALSSRQEAILLAVPEIIMEVDCNKVYTWANRAGVEFFGEDVTGKEAAYYFEGEQDTYGSVQPLFNGDEQVFYVESYQRRRDGQKRLLAWWCRVLKDAQGTMTGALSTARDITERKRTEEALLQSEELYRGIFENASIGITRVSLDGIYREVNPAMARTLGYSPAELVGMPVADFTYPDESGQRAQFLRDLIEGRIVSGEQERRFVHRNGSVVWTLINASVQRDQSGQPLHFISLVQDITERKRAEKELRESEDRYRVLVEVSSEAMLLQNREGKIVYANPSALRLLHASKAEDFLGQDYLNLVHPEDREESEKRAQRSGMENQPAPMREHRLITLDGKVVYVESTGFPVKQQGQQHMLGISEDITERKQAEEELLETNRRLEEATARANSMAAQAEMANVAKSEFLANMSHEIRTPMNGVIGMTGLLLDTELNEEQRRYAEIVRASGESLLGLINDILDFSKIEAEQTRPGDAGLRSVEPAGRLRRHAGRARPREGAGAALRRRSGRARAAAGRPGPPAPDSHQPGGQRRQVHPCRRGGGPRLAGGRERERCPAALLGARHGHRHPGRQDRPALRQVQPGGRLDHAAIRRHRPGPGHLEATGRADGRRGRREQRRGQRLGVLVHRAPGQTGRGGAGGKSSRPPTCAACAC